MGSLFMSIGSMITSIAAIIPKLFYLLTMCILGVIDLLQMLVRKLAGLDCYYVDGEVQSGDIIGQFITGIFTGQYPILSNAFISLLILGIILLFVTTIIAIIRNEYTTEKDGNSKGKIVGKSFKSLIYFAIIPIICIFGVYLANVVLVAVDKATTHNVQYADTLDTSKLQQVEVSTQTFGTGTVQKTYITYNLFGYIGPSGKPLGTTNTTFSGTIFKAAAYGANRVRTTANADSDENNFGYLLKTEQVTTFDGLFSDPSGNVSKIAEKIDLAFADNVVFAEGVNTKLDYNSSSYVQSYTDSVGDPFYLQKNDTHITANRYNVSLVWYYYDLWQFNYIIALGAGIILTTVFINIIFGLMRRLINLIALFISAAPLIGLMPLDNEGAYNSWRGEFLKNTMMAYGAIGGMNLVMLILPELQTITFFNDKTLDWIVDTILVIVALLAVKDFIGLVSGWAKGADANSVGGNVAKDVGENLAKAGKLAGTALGVGVGAAKVVGKVGMGAAKLGTGALNAIGAISPNAKNYTATAKMKTELSGQHRQKAFEEANASADRRIANIEGSFMNNAGNIANAEAEVRRRYAGLDTADPNKFKQKVNEQMKKDFANDTKRQTAIANIRDRVGLDSQRIYQRKQDAVSVTRREVLANSTAGRAVRGGAESWRANVRDASGIYKVKGFGKFAVGGISSGINYGLSYAEPLVSSSSNLAGEVGGIYSGNNFTKGWSGEDKATMQDIAYRSWGTSLKAVKDAQAKAKKKQEEADAATKQYETMLRALKDSK